MLGLDDWVAELARGQSVPLVLAVALVLGLRHAGDPDHLAAVSTLIASDPDRGTGQAGRLGLAWGLGHAFTLTLFGLPIVLFSAYLPGAAQRGAEALVGLVVVALAARLLMRRRAAAAVPGRRADRTPLQAAAIGLLHGIGGSAGVMVLLLATSPDHGRAAAALVVLALGSAASMAALSSGFGYALARGPVLQRMPRVAPALGTLTLAFGAWYTLGALGAVPYVL
jgi:hypothetical protein